jgi:hypothetical protein
MLNPRSTFSPIDLQLWSRKIIFESYLCVKCLFLKVAVISDVKLKINKDHRFIIDLELTRRDSVGDDVAEQFQVSWIVDVEKQCPKFDLVLLFHMFTEEGIQWIFSIWWATVSAIASSISRSFAFKQRAHNASFNLVLTTVLIHLELNFPTLDEISSLLEKSDVKLVQFKSQTTSYKFTILSLLLIHIVSHSLQMTFWFFLRHSSFQP